jgi:hypothetical protein
MLVGYIRLSLQEPTRERQLEVLRQVVKKSSLMNGMAPSGNNRASTKPVA